MNTIYKAHKTIKTDIADVTDFFAHDDMTQNYFPEVHKSTSGMSEYIHKSHKHLDQVFPDYQIPGQGLRWTSGNYTCIRLPRKDINANIRFVEVNYKTVGTNTVIEIQVGFSTGMNLAGISATYHVHMMVNNKLNAIKRDIEADKHYDFSLAYA